MMFMMYGSQLDTSFLYYALKSDHRVMSFVELHKFQKLVSITLVCECMWLHVCPYIHVCMLVDSELDIVCYAHFIP